MNKKRISIIAFLLSTLLLVCACSLFEKNIPAATEHPVIENTATESPTIGNIVTEVPTIESPVVADESTPACSSQLETMLKDDTDPAGADSLPEADKEYTLVTYQVSGDEISSPKYATGAPAEFVKYQKDVESQKKMWKFFTDVIPADQRKMVSEFIIFSDGYSNSIGAVDQADKPDTWTLEMDIVDSQNFGTLSTTIIHEFGHMLTLNDSQISNVDQSSCTNYMSMDGCSNSDSYINAFYNTFWADIHDEWSSTVHTKDGEVDEDQVSKFYDKYSDQFVTDYAPTGPEEDIAESWMYFVFSPKPAGDTIAEQKILFFYDYPELVQLRQKILGGLCQYTQK